MSYVVSALSVVSSEMKVIMIIFYLPKLGRVSHRVPHRH